MLREEEMFGALKGRGPVNQFLQISTRLSLITCRVLEKEKSGTQGPAGRRLSSPPEVRVSPMGLQLYILGDANPSDKCKPLRRSPPPLPTSYHYGATNFQIPSAYCRQVCRAQDPCARCLLIGSTAANPETRSAAYAKAAPLPCDWLRGCVCRACPDDLVNMAAEGAGDSQLRRRKRRDPEEPEKTELRERELAVAVAVAQENEEDNEERWVGPLPVEAALAKKKKGSYRDRHKESWNAASHEWESSSQNRKRIVCVCGVLCPQNTGSGHLFISGHST